MLIVIVLKSIKFGNISYPISKFQLFLFKEKNSNHLRDKFNVNYYSCHGFKHRRIYKHVEERDEAVWSWATFSHSRSNIFTHI